MSKVWYQGILKATVSGVFEDLKFKISEGSDQIWSCPGSSIHLDTLKYKKNVTHPIVHTFLRNNNFNTKKHDFARIQIICEPHSMNNEVKKV